MKKEEKQIYKATEKDDGKCILCKNEKKEITHRTPIDCLLMKAGQEYIIEDHKFYKTYEQRRNNRR